MNSDQQKRLKTPTDIAEQFKELQELRLKVRRAELAAAGCEHGFGDDANNGPRSQGPKMPNDNSQKS
jgi:hypothetical protein